MSDEPIGVTIKILDKDYRIACKPDEQQGLLDSARMLDMRMREIRQGGRVIGSDRIAVLVALNMAHELLQIQRERGGEDTELSRRLGRLQRRVEDVLSVHPPLDGSAERV